MTWGLATHGIWCHARTYPTHCKYCGEAVFYFTCDCGCKVFFDDLGPPWPEHRCLQYLVAQYGKEIVEHGMAVMMMTPGVEVGRKIGQEYAQRVQRELDRGERMPEIQRCDPYDGALPQEEGIVRELVPSVDMFKRFNIPKDSAFGVSLLGPLARGKYAQVTIHTGALAGEDPCSFTFFVSAELVKRAGIVRGDFVTCRLRGLTIPGREVVWLCEKLTGPFG